MAFDPASVYGRVVLAVDVRAAMQTTVQRWIVAYLDEIGRQRGVPPLQPFRSYNPALTFSERSDNEQLPACYIVAPGTPAAPQRHGGGLYQATWTISVACVAGAKDWPSTLTLIETYAAAVRALVVQHGSLGGFATHVYWEGERYDEITSGPDLTVAASAVQFSVTVPAVVDAGQGPAVPPPDPTKAQTWPSVQTVYVDTRGRP